MIYLMMKLMINFLKKQQKQSENISKPGSTLNLEEFGDSPTLPQSNEADDEEYDLQKELEAKFDELFGPLDDDNE